ncbi:MAG: endolytic transglycosylase MltG [Oscillospiraceae bacterium]|nr:endolytic transglycosylase MltG [Oscillospiraceae bacterium]
MLRKRMYSTVGLLLSLCLFTGIFQPVQAAFQWGDVDGDGKIGVGDARLILQYLVGKTALTPSQLAVADVDGDENVTIADARKVLQYLVDKVFSINPPLPLTVRVTIPEGKTLDEIAALLEKKRVCPATDFYAAVQNGDFFDYDFIRDLPESPGRGHRLEGYLFPDTYEFYTDSSAASAIRRMLNNFTNRIVPLRPILAESDRTIHDIVLMASIIEREVYSAADMKRVSRVLHNRLHNPAEFPRLQCDSTGEYVDKVNAAGYITLKDEDYNTYQRRGMPAGPISNPGLNALTAAVYPSEEASVISCYFFASDITTGITYFSKTYAEHVEICERYKIGVHQ